MPLPIKSLLPLHGLTITLRFNQRNRLNFFHQTGLAPFIRCLAGSPENFDSLIKIDAPESGRHEYLLGDCYRFSLFALNGGQEVLSRLIGALQQLPFSTARDDANMPFRRNLELEALHDAFSGRPITHFQQLSPYTVKDLHQECGFWQAVPAFRMQLLSPVRLLKDKQLRTALKGEARYSRQKSDLTAELISNRLYDNFAALLSKQAVSNLPPREQPAALTLDDSSHLFWLNVHYTDADAKTHAMGGMTGEIVMCLNAAEAFDWTLWVLGQYTGFGQRSAFGFGRYRLQTLARQASFNRTLPAASLLSAISATANLVTALEHIQSNAEQAGNSQEPGDDEDALLERLHNDINKLLASRFTPPPLQGFIIDTAANNTRLLAVPPFRDRVLQRAVAQVLQPIVETLQYQHSYGYRAGRSRVNAFYAIQSAWREGYRWVYESDIEDFFDCVNWQRLEVRLRALWGDDPIVAALCRWMQAPVDFQGQTIKRFQGLPQGSPLSPLLANIMLDNFDNDMQAAGFKLIRYADDFVVLCKSREQAQLAHQAAEASLLEHGLTLNKDKTQISRMDDGFYYLGYLFVNDLALESPARLRTQAADDAISRHSWLSLVTAREPEAIVPPDKQTPLPVDSSTTKPSPEGECARPTPASAQHYGERDQHGLLLCITGDSCMIRTQDERLVIERGEQSLYDVPWRQLHAVLLLGRHNITTPALLAAMEHNIALHFASMTGKYQGVVWSGMDRQGKKGQGFGLNNNKAFPNQPMPCLSAVK